jgi:phage gp36-like protein
MAAYTTPEKVRAILARDDSQVARTAASLGDDRITDAVQQASDVIDGYLGARYTVPFASPVPSLISTIAEAVAAYRADLTFRQGTDYDSVLDPVYLRCKECLQQLADIRDGKMDVPGLPTNDGGGIPAGGATVLNQYSGQLFWPADFDLVRDIYPRRDPRVGWF